MDKFKHQILTSLNQKVAHEKQKYLQTILICKIKLKLKGYLTLLGQVKWFVTWWVKTCIIRWNGSRSKKEMDQERILTYSGVNCTLRRWLALLDNSWSSTTKKLLKNKKYLTINTIKPNFVKKNSSIIYPVKRLSVEQGRFLKRE